jgi:hypothetical protein
VANSGLSGVRVAAVSGKPYLPVGGAGTTLQSPELLIFDYYDPDEISERVTRIPLQDLTIESDSPFSLSGINVELDWAQILQDQWYGTVSKVDQQRYNLAYYLELEFFGTNFSAFAGLYHSRFASSVHFGYEDPIGVFHDARYKMFDSGAHTVWLVYPERAFR